MKTTCAFCGMAPLDGLGCCTPDYRASTMRRADADIRRMQSELAALRRRAEDAEMLLRIHGDCRFKVWAIRDYMPERYNLPRMWKIRCLAHGLSATTTLKADPTTGLPILTDEAREALRG